MPIPDDLQLLMQERRTAEEREARAETRRALLGTLVRLVLSVAAGMVLIGLSLHTGDESAGQLWWWCGWLVWVGGVMLTLHHAYKRGVERGDWR